MALVHDIPPALRVLSRSRPFALTSIAVLALGIGAKVAISGVVVGCAIALREE